MESAADVMAAPVPDASVPPMADATVSVIEYDHAEESKTPTGRGSKKHAWTPEEDQKLTMIVTMQGQGQWTKVAAQLPNRQGRQCRERWFNRKQLASFSIQTSQELP